MGTGQEGLLRIPKGGSDWVRLCLVYLLQVRR